MVEERERLARELENERPGTSGTGGRPGTIGSGMSKHEEMHAAGEAASASSTPSKKEKRRSFQETMKAVGKAMKPKSSKK